MDDELFQFVPQFLLGVATNQVNVYSLKFSKRIIGYIEAKYIPRFVKGDYGKFTPIDNWRNEFSLPLQIELGMLAAVKTN